MFPTSDLRDSNERTALPRPRRPRRGLPVKRRRGFWPELETVEDRCLLSSYAVTAMTYPGGYLVGSAAINNLGQVAGSGSYPVNNAVVWQNNSITNLDPLQSYGMSYAVDLTNPAPGHEADVQVVGHIPSAASSNGNVFLWVGGTMYDTLIPNSASNGLAISNNGVVAGGYQTADPNSHAYVWIDKPVGGVKNQILDTGELQDLNGLFANQYGSALRSAAVDVIDATSADSHLQVVANALVPRQGGLYQWHAFLLTDTNGINGFEAPAEVTDLGTLRGGGDTEAHAINNVGQITGFSGGNAFRWQNGVMTDLGKLNNYGLDALAINNGGQVVGTANGPGGPASRAWIWTGSGSIKDLNGQIPKNSGWTLGVASGINDAGRIVGVGAYPPLSNTNTYNVAFLLTPTSGPAAAVSIASAGLTDAKTAGQAPVQTATQSPLARTVAPPSKPAQHGVLIPLMPVTDQDFTLLATELIRSGTKRPRPALWG